MTSTLAVALLVVATSVGGIGAENVNPHAQILEDFEARIREYTKLRQQAEAGLPVLKPTDSPEEIRRHEHQLAQAIRRQRGRAKQGDLFTPKISAEFRRLIGITFRGSEARRIRVSLKHSEPVSVALHVNDNYPEGVPLQTTPPTLLLNLPKLPPELEYRVVGQALVLRDVKANLIVDFMPKALSQI